MRWVLAFIIGIFCGLGGLVLTMRLFDFVHLNFRPDVDGGLGVIFLVYLFWFALSFWAFSRR